MRKIAVALAFVTCASVFIALLESTCSTKQHPSELRDRIFYEGPLAIHTFADGWTLMAGLSDDGSKHAFLWRRASEPTGFGSAIEPATTFASLKEGAGEVAAIEREGVALAQKKDAAARGEPVPPALTPDIPILTIACIGQKTYLFVDVNNPGEPEGRGYERTVRITLDGSQPWTERWEVTRIGRALFAPDAISLAQKISSGQSLLVEFRPFERPPARLRFDLSGLSVHIAQVAEPCGGWGTARTRSR